MQALQIETTRFRIIYNRNTIDQICMIGGDRLWEKRGVVAAYLIFGGTRQNDRYHRLLSVGRSNPGVFSVILGQGAVAIEAS